MGLLSEFELWMFLAGLGIFLFGMHMMEESIRVLSGGAFKSLIRKYAGTRPRAISSGMISTAVLQSSSAVSLMVLAFVGAGIMNLVQAISVMMGAKIGTTATAWIVAVFGFEFNIDSFTLPLIGIGGLGIIVLAKSLRYVNISKLLVAFGFLFMGLDYMKTSVDQVSELIDPAMFSGYGIIVFAIAGMVMTAIMQSSSATIAIVLTMLFSGVIDFEAGAAMVVGANVGTTVTVLLGSIGGVQIKKQAAFSQLVFTVTTAAVTLLILPLLAWVVLTGFGFDQNVVLGLALFHTIFNVLGVVLFYRFIPALAVKAEQWIPEKETRLSVYIHKTDPAVAEAGMEAFRKEVGYQLMYTLTFIDSLFKPEKRSPGVGYSDLEKYHAKLFSYYTQIHLEGLGEEDSVRLDQMLRASRNIMNTAKNINDAIFAVTMLKKESDEFNKAAFFSIKSRVFTVIDKGLILHKIIDGEDIDVDVDLVLTELAAVIDRSDKEFINRCGDEIRRPKSQSAEITSLLMLNRSVTQSCRMILFSLEALLNTPAREGNLKSEMIEIEH